MSTRSHSSAGTWGQLTLLIGLWWRHMRRRPRRLGDLPKQSGVPTFLLINLLSLGYLTPLAFSTIKSAVDFDLASFAWHALGLATTGIGTGCASHAAVLQPRGGRNDLFLEALPISPTARLGLSLMDGYLALLFALIVPLAGASAARSGFVHGLFAVLFGCSFYVAMFLAGRALRAWACVLGPPAAARIAGYLGTGLSMVGFGLMFFALGPLIGARGWAAWFTRAWLLDDLGLCALFACAALLAFVSLQALGAAERAGFDRLDAPANAPRRQKGVRTRAELERLMIWRQGGVLLLIAFSALLVAMLLGVEFLAGARVREQALAMALGMVTYLGAIQAIALAGRSARGDLLARPFLSALPLAPHQVLEGKVSALRRLLIPVFFALACVAVMAARERAFELSLRASFAWSALHMAVAGAVAVAFISSGVGVAGVAGGQVGSSFSTQLLLMPLMATVFAVDSWAAAVSLLAVAAVSLEAQRAARLSIRWIDDPDEGAERETSVWRALLAATVFFSTQALSSRLLAAFELSAGYSLALGFVLASGVLALLTMRNDTRFARPRVAPRSGWYLLLGLAAGAASGRAALWMMTLLPQRDSELGASFGTNEQVALVVATVIVAPLAEEYFFRGWLQQAIERDLPAQRKRWAFALGALAFALAHVGSYGLPQLVLGLIAGALYVRAGGLGPSMLAHAAHNAVVMWVLSRS
jgi:membrane protease YdiL (CAAX protease family)